MVKVNEKNYIQAYQLGTRSHTEILFIIEKKLAYVGNGQYEIFSKDDPGTWKDAKVGDFIKVNDDDYPELCNRDEFLTNHRYVGGDLYEKI